MMKGHNTFSFNQATMIEAMQLYMDKVLSDKVTVHGVVEEKSTNIFIVSVESKEEV